MIAIKPPVERRHPIRERHRDLTRMLMERVVGKWTSEDARFFEQHLADLEATAEQRGRDEAAGKWVACSERMPELCKNVLVFNRGVTRVGYYNAEGRWWSAMGQHGCDPFTSVTHWMPLPAPPGKTP